jgi:hypothetical protein
VSILGGSRGKRAAQDQRELIDNRFERDRKTVRGELYDPGPVRGRGESSDLNIYFVIPNNAVMRDSVTAIRESLLDSLLESLILAQDERWRRA